MCITSIHVSRRKGQTILLLICLVLLSSNIYTLIPRYKTEVLSGNPYMGTTLYDGMNGIDGVLNKPQNVLLYNEELYISDTGNHMIRKVSKNGTLSTLVGVGSNGNNEEDGLLGIDTQLNNPNGLSISPSGDLLFIADTGNQFIRVLNMTSNICTIFKFYTSSGSLDTLSKPFGVSITKEWNIYITDDKYVKKVNYYTRLVSIIAGGGSGTVKDNVVPTTIALSDSKLIHHIPYSDTSGSGYMVVFSDTTSARVFSDINNLQSLKVYASDTGLNGIFPISTTNMYYSLGNAIGRITATGARSIISSVNNVPRKYEPIVISSSAFNSSYGIHGNSSEIYISDSLNYSIRKLNFNTSLVSTVVGFKYQPSLEGVYALSVFADLKIKKLLLTNKEEMIFLDTLGRIRMIRPDDGRIKTLIGSEYTSIYTACSSVSIALECTSTNANGIAMNGVDGLIFWNDYFFSYNLSTISGSSKVVAQGNPTTLSMFRSMNGFSKSLVYFYDGSGLWFKQIADIASFPIKTVSGLTDFNIANIPNTDSALICYIVSGSSISCFNQTGSDIVLPTPKGETNFTSIFVTTSAVYVSTSNRIYSYSTSDYSSITLIAGIMPVNVSGQSFDFSGYNSDYVLATNAILNDISNLQVTSNGNIYFVSGGTLIRRIANGFVSTVAGISPLHTDGITPMAITRDPVKKITYFIDNNTHVKKLDESTGTISPLTFPITPSIDPQNVVLPYTFLRVPPKSAGQLLTFSSYDGLLYLADYCRIITINVATGSYNLVTGTTCGESTDNTLAINSLIQTPSSMTVDSSNGDLYLSFGTKIKKISKQTGLLTTLYGSTGIIGSTISDGIISKTTLLTNITSMAVLDNIIYFADISRSVRQIALSNSNLTTLTTVSGAITEKTISISLAKNGEIFIIDSYTSTVKKFVNIGTDPINLAGKQFGKGFNGRYNSQGKNSNFRNLISSVAIDNGIILTELSDKSGGLIKKLTAQCDGNTTLESSSGTCVCNYGYSGDSCGQFLCFGVVSSTSGVCSGNGTCVGVDLCSCNNGFEGSLCNVVKSTNGTVITDNQLGVILPAVLVPVLVILIIIVIIIVSVIIVFALRKKKKDNKKLEETTLDMDDVPMSDLPSDMSVILSSSLTRSVSSSTNEEENLFTRYQDIEKIGQGAFGSVFKVRDTKDGDKIKAVKVLKFNSVSDLNMIMKEGAQLTNAKHSHILKVNDYFITNDNLLCIDMDYYEKGDLSQFTKNDCPEPIVKQILYQLSDALSYVHGTLSMIHRDIKPTNIFVKEYDGSKVFVILADFGLAKQAQESAANSYAGTPLYMSPELGLGGKYYPNSDTYSLGVTIYQIMTKDTTTSISHLLLNDPQNAESKLREKMKQSKMNYSNQLIDLVIRMLDKDSLTRPNAQDVLSDPYFMRSY